MQVSSRHYGCNWKISSDVFWGLKLTQRSFDWAELLFLSKQCLFVLVKLESRDDVQWRGLAVHQFLFVVDFHVKRGFFTHNQDTFWNYFYLIWVLYNHSNNWKIRWLCAYVLNFYLALRRLFWNCKEKRRIDSESRTADDVVMSLRKNNDFLWRSNQVELKFWTRCHHQNWSRLELESLVNGKSNFVAKMLVTWFYASCDDFQIARS